MSILKKLFGGGDRLGRLRQAVQQQRWADALVEGEGLDATLAASDEVAQLLATAGDSLAELNLAEGEACLRAGQRERAREHFSLAAGQARSENLQHKAQTRLQPDPPLPIAVAAAQTCCPSGCAPGASATEVVDVDGLDLPTRLELILSGYPSELAQRYLDAPEVFHTAVILAYQGEDAQALAAMEEVPAGLRDSLFHFERGSLLARTGAGNRAIPDLEQAAAMVPAHPLAGETLVNLELALGLDAAAEQRLRQLLAAGGDPAFCHGRLASILARRGDLAAALESAQVAIGSGNDGETLHLAAMLFERNGQLAEAEDCLARLSSPGCGSHNLFLAEFWLRQGQHPDRALEAFKAGLRQEPGNPRWTLRIAQAYLALGWRREGMKILEKALAAPDLTADLRREGEILLESPR
ncbi:MAG: hypothetical protein IH614_17410 [Desulfuromonadales bacterium]|nr:hypothetical protein [Desulfuromonadales bacterium]